MRVILDECVPRPLGSLLTGHHATTVQQQGWAGTKNGKLLQRIDDAGFEAFITVDKDLPRQNALRGLRFGVIVLKARSNKLDELGPLAPKILVALEGLLRGDVRVVAKTRR